MEEMKTRELRAKQDEIDSLQMQVTVINFLSRSLL